MSSQYKQKIHPAVLRAWLYILKTIYPYYNTQEIDDGKLEFIIDDLEEELDDDPDIVEVLDNILEEDIQKEVDEIQYIENDPVRKYQTEVGDSFLLLPENTEKDAVVKRKKTEGTRWSCLCTC